MKEFIFLFSDSVGDHPTILLVVLLFLPLYMCHTSFQRKSPINCVGNASFKRNRLCIVYRKKNRCIYTIVILFGQAGRFVSLIVTIYRENA